MAAKVELFTEDAVIEYMGQPVGKGPGVIELRDYNVDLDIPEFSGIIPDPLIHGISNVFIVFGHGLGRVAVLTGKHDTTINTESTSSAIGLGDVKEKSSTRVILDETYGQGNPRSAPIIGKNGEVLAIVSHQSSKDRK